MVRTIVGTRSKMYAIELKINTSTLLRSGAIDPTGYCIPKSGPQCARGELAFVSGGEGGKVLDRRYLTFGSKITDYIVSQISCV